MLGSKGFKKCILMLTVAGIIGGGYGTYRHFMSEAFSVQRFRSTHDIKIKDKDVDLTGLETLNVSGSNRPVFADLKERLKHVKGKIYVVDLTGGEQTFFKGKYPIEFLGRRVEDQRHFVFKVRRFLVNGFSEFKPEDFVSEAEMAKNHGFEYIQLYNERGLTPRGKMLDDIVKIVESIGPDDHIHFHCSAGRGRTTVAMVVVDILKNGRRVPLDHIIRRAHLMGGENLYDTEVWANGTYTLEKLTSRKQRIIDFYKYVNDPEGYGKRSWVDWCHLNNKDGLNDGLPRRISQLDRS
jgi:hypothetical protein